MSQSSQEKAVASYGITEAQVKSALLADKGSDAQLTSWAVVDFTKKGDNYVCVVTSVELTYTLENKENKTSYVIKIFSEQPSKGFNDIIQFSSITELKFYEELVPALNTELEAAGQPSLHVPDYFYTGSEGSNTVIFLEDLRSRGFKMHSRHQSLDAAHTKLVLQELAKLHAASLLLQEKIPSQQLANKYHYVYELCFSVSQDAVNFFTEFMVGHLENAILILEKVGNYSAAVKWLQNLKTQIYAVIDSGKENSSPFTVFCHGDCWTNNFLFRYCKSTGVPVEVAFVDHQLAKRASLATDLNCFFFTSLDQSTRQQNINIFLDTYYNALTKVVEASGLTLQFTRQELQQEYRKRHDYGIIWITMVVPLIISDGNDAPDYKDMSDEKMIAFLDQQKDNLLNKLIQSPLLKARFLSIFDELMEIGMIR